MKTVVVLQARTNSSRLPAKVLLPLGKVPLVVLAARRAGNTGRRVLVATSEEASDDALADLLDGYGIEYSRGSLNDTLGRFVSALRGYDDDTAVVRLTADNPLPDGVLIDELLAEFEVRGVGYLACNGAPSGLPYGLSAEVVTLGLLREAAQNSSDASDREHVTPYVIRKCGISWFEKYVDLGMGHFRCTVDNYDDYQSLLHVFSGEPDPTGAPTMRLLGKLRDAPFQPIGRAGVPKLVVGGAQLGMPYGIANRAGPPSPRMVTAMLKCAIANGVGWIDTAHSYSGSEEIIGQALSGGWAERVRVVTKTTPLSHLSPDADPATAGALLDAGIFASCARLRRSKLDAVILHRTSQLSAWGGVVWQRLREAAAEGRVGALGVSVQSPEELEQALGFGDVEFIQLPFNMLDWRWDDAVACLVTEKSRRPITVHVRSALLQGLLVSSEPHHWRRAHVSSPQLVQNWLSEQVRRFGRSDVIDMCLAFVRSQPWIDGVVVGMETMEQLQANIRYFLAGDLAPKELAQIRSERPRLAPETLDPSCWSAA